MHINSTESASNDSLSFSVLPLQETLLTNLVALGYEKMTPIQTLSLPKMLNGGDVIAKAHTGSGKTAAFGLTLLNQIKRDIFSTQALVLCPTRELAEQVSQAIRQLARLMPNVKIINLSGGMPMKPQLDSLKHGAHIVVGTPGRIQKHLDKSSLALNQLSILVLDEADRMLEMGFLEAIRSVVKCCPKQRQTLLFSATYPDDIKHMSYAFMQNPTEVFIEHTPEVQDIEQRFYDVTEGGKFTALTSLLKHHNARSTLIFCNTKQMTTDITHFLKQAGFSAVALNGDMEQVDRDRAMILFSHESCSILVATDVAARGLDIKELPLVINYELAFERDTHTHRIGRTGRAGQKGLAISLTTAADGMRICAIEDTETKPLVWEKLSELTQSNQPPTTPTMITLCLDAGKKDKIRAGDILGALTKDGGLPVDAIGKINVFPLKSYVAIHKNHATQAYQYFQRGTLKGRRVRVQKMAMGT
jgi:ATP-independent RNA helicase DbpA